MFDHVNYEMDCPTCGTRLKGFQSKDGNCNLEVIESSEVYQFYTHCPNCKTWVQFDRKSEREKKYTINDYELTVKTLEDREKEWEARKKEMEENECSYCKGTGKKVTDMKNESIEKYMKEWEMDNGKMMAQILKQEVYCESGRLSHLFDDRKMEEFIDSLDSEKEQKCLKCGIVLDKDDLSYCEKCYEDLCGKQIEETLQAQSKGELVQFKP